MIFIEKKNWLKRTGPRAKAIHIRIKYLLFTTVSHPINIVGTQKSKYTEQINNCVIIL
jgi:hypothetical protein